MYDTTTQQKEQYNYTQRELYTCPRSPIHTPFAHLDELTSWDREGEDVSPLGLALRRCLREQLRLLDGRHRLLDELLLILDDTDISLGQVLDRLIRYFPQLFGDLGNET